jgi:hypothetical protein
MSNQYKLSVAAYLLVPMIFSLANGESETKFDFKLEAKRLTQEEWNERIKGEAGVPTNDKVKEVLLDITTGWRDQTLVQDELGKPAPFCREALEVMFTTPGVLELYVTSYLKEVLAKVKN